MRIVTDSAAALPRPLARREAIEVVPLSLVVGTETYRDGDLSIEELLGRLHEAVTTSGAGPGDVTKAVEDVLGPDGVVVLTVSRRMSSTYDAARVAARAVPGAVRVVDTQTAAGAQALVALHAARSARTGGDLDAVEAAARFAASRVRLVATVDSLDRLVASGRVPEIAGRAGALLHVNPLFEFVRGRVRPLRPAFTREAALDRIVATLRRSARRERGRLHVAALHAHDEPTATRLLEQVRVELEPATAFVAGFSSVMIVHTGAGLAGLAWWWEPHGEETGSEDRSRDHSTATRTGPTDRGSKA